MNDRELFLYELEGRGYTFENMTWLGNCFEDDILNMVWGDVVRQCPARWL